MEAAQEPSIYCNLEQNKNIVLTTTKSPKVIESYKIHKTEFRPPIWQEIFLTIHTK